MSYLHTPGDVLQYAAQGRLEEWVHAYLQGEGQNQPMSDGLRLQPRYWIGPVRVPLQSVQRCNGPEPHMEYVDDPVRWEQSIAAMVRGLERGWIAPPMIAQFLPGGVISVRDGNHRHEALRRTGQDAYWCVIWCDSPELKEEALRYVTEAPGPQKEN